jgi:8-oxo-dGTP diphosphatase
MAPARFVALHEIPESALPASTRFAVMLARHADGVVLVFSRWRKVWELPGGLIDPGESARQCAVREFREETGGEAGEPEWLGCVEVNDGSTHFGGVYRCTAREVPESFTSEETGGLASWARDRAPSPLGHADAALLNRFA